MSHPLVVDASVVCKWYFTEAFTPESVALLDSGRRIVVPDILPNQVSLVLWRRVKANQLSLETAHRIQNNLRALPLEVVAAHHIQQEALEIASLTTRTYNESLYFALAMREHTKLITADRPWFTLVSTGPMRNYVTFVSDAARRLSELRAGK